MNRKPLLFFFVLALSALGFCFHGCTSPPAITASQQLNDSLEYYFTVANDDSMEIAIRRHCAERARILTEKLPKDSIYVKNMFRVANRYWNLSDYEHYYEACRYIRPHLSGNVNDLAKFNSYLADYFVKKAIYPDSIVKYTVIGRQLSRRAKNKDLELEMSLALAQFRCVNDDYYGGQKLAWQCVKLAKDLHAKESLSRAYTLIGLTYFDSKEYELSVAFHKRSMIPGLPNAFYDLAKHNIGLSLMAKGHYYPAIKAFKSNLKSTVRSSQIDLYATALDNIGTCYLKMGLFRKAFPMIKLSERIRDSIGSFAHIAQSKMNLSDYYARTGDTLSAIAYADTIKFRSHQLHFPVSELNALRKLLSLDKQHFAPLTERFLHLSDSLQLAERRNRNKFAQIEYQTSELKEQNQQLLTQNQKITIGASSVGVLLLVGLFARHYRARKKEVQLLRERQAADDEIFQLLQQQQEKVEEGRKLEKRRISQELHDGVMGKLSGIRLNLFVLNKRSDPETISKCLGHIDKIQEVEKEIRSIAYDLENDLFGEDRSFSALLRTLVQSAKEVSTTQFHLDLDAAIQWDSIPNTVKIQLYRVLQEALTNIRKYAKAKTVHITLRQRKQHLWVVVTDDGIGFTPSTVQKGLGLTNMETRIRRQGGAFKLKSVESQGTTLIFTLPITT